VTSTNPGPSGAFHFATSSRTWTWSEPLFELFGFAPGDVVPTRELFLSHVHPEDREDVEAGLDAVLATGRPTCLWHRVVDAHGTTRQVVTVADVATTGDGAADGIVGHSVDVTEAVRLMASRDVDDALEQMSQSRPTIEQAKGALMMRYGVDEEASFGLLRRYSQHANIKVRDVARDLVQKMSHGQFADADLTAWDGLAAELTGGASEEAAG
jgi:hypothetical protein